MVWDKIIITSAVLGFLAYLIAHLVVFRFIGIKGILDWLMRIFFIGGSVNLGACLRQLLQTNLPQNPNMGLVLFGSLISFFLYGLLCFFYVICVYGAFESSLSVRIFRELDKFPAGLTRSEVLKFYNAEMILRTRLERFIGSGEVLFDGKSYRIGKTSYVFVFLQGISKTLKHLIQAIRLE